MGALIDSNPFYARYDRALTLLPAELRSKSCLTQAGEDWRTGVVTLRDARGRELAQVDEEGTVVIAERHSLRTTIEKQVRAGVDDTVKGFRKKLSQVVTAIMWVDGRVKKTEERIGSEAFTKGIDAQAFDVLEEICTRLDRVEASMATLAETQFTYRGYWRTGMHVKRNEAVTEEGSLWIALNDTLERPNSTSQDWSLAARKGRDGKDAR